MLGPDYKPPVITAGGLQFQPKEKITLLKPSPSKITSVEAAIQMAREKRMLLSSGFRPLNRGVDPEKSQLVPGEVRVRCSLDQQCLGWTYDILNFHQKYLDGR